MNIKGDSAYVSGLRAARKGDLVLLTPCQYEGEDVVVETLLDPGDYRGDYIVNDSAWRGAFLAAAMVEIRNYLPDRCVPT